MTRDRHIQSGLGDRGEDVARPGPRLQRQARSLLDHASVHHGVGERDTHLDGIGARILDLAEQRRVHPRVAARDVRDERPSAGVTARAERSFEVRHPSPSAPPGPCRGPCRRAPRGTRARSFPLGAAASAANR